MLTESKQISSRLTFLHKFVLPMIFVVSLINFGWLFLIGRRFDEPVDFPIWAAPLASIGFFLFTFLFYGSIKKVGLDDKNLYVSNFQKEIVVPISNMVYASELLLSRPRRVTIHLNTSSEFGRKIVFLAPYRPFAFLDPHPIVEELNRLARGVN